MAYALFILIGLLFDLVMLAISGGIIFVLLRPEMVDRGAGLLNVQMATNEGKLQLLIIAVAGVVLSFRGLFVLLFGRGTPELTVSTDSGGSVTIAHQSIEHILRRLVQQSVGGASLKASAAKSAGTGAVNLRLRIELDLVDTNLNEYTKGLEETVRGHFRDRLGLEVKSLRIRAECAPVKGVKASGGQG